MARRSESRPVRNRRSSGVLNTLLICVAIVVAALVLKHTGRSEAARTLAPTVVAEFDTVSLPVPVNYVPSGTKVRDIELKMVAFPRHQIPEGALETLGSLTDAVTVTPLPANLPLFKENLSLTSQGSNPVLDRIPPGMRAMTIKVDATSAVEGWAGSGSIVDVLLIEKNKTSVIAEKVKIISAERSVSPVEGSSSPGVPSTVTLLVTQEQCLAISTAVPLGRIAFALRSMKDESEWVQTSYTAERLKGDRGTGQGTAGITGFIAVKQDTRSEQYALTDGKWIRTQSVPQGFLPARERNE